MKVIKKITAIMLSIMMVLGMCSVVGADTSEPNSGRIDEDQEALVLVMLKQVKHIKFTDC